MFLKDDHVGVAIILDNDDDIVLVTRVGQVVVIIFLSSSNFVVIFNGEDDVGDQSCHIIIILYQNDPREIVYRIVV